MAERARAHYDRRTEIEAAGAGSSHRRRNFNPGTQ
ncbi:hypothetical protein VTH06DRAFT_2931 [Thermothelomyces fergusii]